ncbi:SusC/RagA family TonB-linked outer membrane protein, partial [Bacteroides xylanisolvens]
MSNKVKNMRSWLLMLFAAISLGVSAQTITVKGNVKDTTGEPIIGASVVEKGNTTNGTITDLDGNYSIKVPSKATLTISYIGMKTLDIAVKGQSQINVTLSDDTQALDEVVVIGYGTVAKKDLTGSVSSVSAKQIAAIPVSSASEALQGKMAGVSITTTEGSPDADVKIRVRGGGSLSQDNSPLYIVDGFPVSSISDIAPTDIQSVDVLKDASSTAIYGARGANGVIIITTKSGQEGKIQVNLGASFGVRKVTKMVDVLNPYEYVLWQQEIDQEGMKYGMFDDLDIYKSMKGTDYQDEIFGRTGNQQQYNVSVSGGNKDTKFSVSYAHNEEKSIMLGSGFSKENINAKLNTNINKWLTMDFNARFSYQTIDGISGGADANESSAANSLISRSVIYKPVEEINTTSSDSDDDENVNNAQYNPLERLNATYKKQTRLQQNYNVGLNWKPIKGLTFRSEFGYGWRYNNTDQVWGVEATSNSKYGYYGQPQALLNKVVNKNWRNANTVTYDTKFLNNTHKLNVMLGHEVSSSYDHETINTSVAFSKYMTISDVLSGMSNGTALPTSTYIGFKDNLLSFFGRVNYTIQDKYLMTFTMRADGSSKFSKGNQWGYFPSLALAWRISDEAWMERSKEWLSNLKLRLSVGTAGNNRIKSGAINSTFSLAETSDKNIYFNETSAVVLQHASNLSNPDLKWETTLTRNLGIDFGFWDNRLSGSIDAYWNTTKDL